MEAALYHPEHGYYRRKRDPFGKDGDFFTAAQLQPAFGELVRGALARLDSPKAVLDLGAGRGEMRESFPEWEYRALDYGDALPDRFRGVVFANELFDALPCRAFGESGESPVDWRDGRFVFTIPPVREECPRAESLLAEIAACHDEGLLLIVDYGYEERERLRFPNGTLLSYRRHAASEDVLASPGDRDITAHVNFFSLERVAATLGYEKLSRTSLASLLLSAGEEIVARCAKENSLRTRTLLFGMGETFQALLLRRAARAGRSTAKSRRSPQG